MWKEFKDFAIKGNVIDMAIGIIIGTAFGAIVKSMVADVIMPPVGLLFGDTDFANFFFVLKEGVEAAGPYATLADAQAAGAVTLNYGVFLNTVINFLIIAWVIFLVIRAANRAQREQEAEAAAEPAAPTTKDCPHCFTSISIKATRCPQCTSELTAA